MDSRCFYRMVPANRGRDTERASTQSLRMGNKHRYGRYRRSGNAVTDFAPFYNNAGQQFVPKVWGLLAVCVGTGHGVFHVSTNEDFSNFTNASSIGFPACNGEPTLSIIRHPPASQTRAVMAMPSGNMLWQVLLLGCTSADVAACK